LAHRSATAAARRSSTLRENLINPNDPVNRENAAFDRMINGICRGCLDIGPSPLQNVFVAIKAQKFPNAL
jgi:hypothetical protein